MLGHAPQARTTHRTLHTYETSTLQRVQELSLLHNQVSSRTGYDAITLGLGLGLSLELSLGLGLGLRLGQEQVMTKSI